MTKNNPPPTTTTTTTMLPSHSASAGIPLNHAPEGAGYKLLELPPELLALLESESPPALRLEPPPPSTSTTSSTSSTAALLRTPDGSQTWSLRQKNTSNALILLRADASGRALDAVATLHETVELVPEQQHATKMSAQAAPRGKWHERFGRTR